MFNDNPIMLIGMLSDKDHYSYVRNIRKISNRVIFTRPAEPGRSLDPNILLSESGNLFKEAKVIEDPVEAYEYSKSLGESVLVTGSMYLVGVVAEIENMNTFPY
jgi:Folylpolyglutamate synthase